MGVKLQNASGPANSSRKWQSSQTGDKPPGHRAVSSTSPEPSLSLPTTVLSSLLVPIVSPLDCCHHLLKDTAAWVNS